jgi:deoxyribodipyrimidine photo-lyase
VLARRYAQAMAGETGIACFDAWAAELVEHGWLHNHTRMWFASIWIFTLRLPWQLGADFFYTHLLDADPASNTLSWRWVAGLHTRGKHYLARADNIERNTLGRFAPYGALNEQADPLPADEEPPPPMALRALPPPPRGRVALLVTEEDLHPESWVLAQSEVAAIAVLPTACASAPDSPALRFSNGALDDAAGRAADHFGVEAAHVSATDLPAWAQRTGVTTIVTADPPVGAIAAQVRQIERALEDEGVALHRLRRDWDQALWPLATAGFFKLKARLPAVINSMIAA